jgi:protease I
MKSALLVIAPEMFRDEEYAEPLRVLTERGADVTTASTMVGTAKGRFGMTAEATITHVDAADRPWDAVAFIGGAGASVYFDDPAAHKLAFEAASRGAVVAAICIAPSILAHAGLLEGRRATAFESRLEDLIAYGAEWTGESVTVDGRLITANGPEAATEFSEAISDMLELPERT